MDQYASAHGVAAERTRRWLSVMALIGVLETVTADEQPRFLIKGGVSIELRLGLRARTTKDVDVVFRGSPDEMVDALEEAFEHSYGNFAFRRKRDVERIRGTDSHRLEVQVSFGGRDWQTLQLEVGPPEADEAELVPVAISIEGFKLDGPRRVACLSLRYQIAQKLHAVTEQPTDRENQRFWDLMDLILLRGLIPELGPVHEACVDVFAARATHSWPPRLSIPESWVQPYARLAAEHDFPVGDVYAAAEQVRLLIASIDEGIPVRHPRVGQTWRRVDGRLVHIEQLRIETAVVSETDPSTGTTVGAAIDPAEIKEMVLADDPDQPTWLLTIEASYGSAASEALWRIGTIEAAGRQITPAGRDGPTPTPGVLSSSVTARVVAPDESTVLQLARAVLPAQIEILRVSRA